MDLYSNLGYKDLEVGDIVREVDYIVPPDREPWHGVVIEIKKEHYEDSDWLNGPQYMATILWIKPVTIEYLPACVLILVQEAK